MDRFEGDLVADVASIGDNGRTPTEGEWGDLNASSPKAARRIEDMVLSFLSQLSTFGVTRPHGTSSDSDLSESSQDRTVSRPMKAKVELQLVDRTKLESYGNQRTVDSVGITPSVWCQHIQMLIEYIQLVDDVAATFQLERSDLSIRGASKGLIVGSGLTIHLHAGEAMTIMDTEGSLIPSAEEIQYLTIDTSISWVLVVEKETLCRLGITRLLPRGLMITGKGYPDIATRHLLKLLGDLLHAR
ncbi:hypothetical protein H0H93_016463 [Arthromyces matolae]|nr:hypothetical protein H0H93_016463 [Arthromyces matolae]